MKLRVSLILSAFRCPQARVQHLQPAPSACGGPVSDASTFTRNLKLAVSGLIFTKSIIFFLLKLLFNYEK